MDRLRADIHDDFEGHPLVGDVRAILRKTHPDDLVKLLGLMNSEKTSIRDVGDEKVFTYDGEDIIDTIDKAVLKSGADLSIWEVSEQFFKTYTVTMKLKMSRMVDGKPETYHEPIQKTNYCCNIRFKKKGTDWTKIIDNLSSRIKTDIKLPTRDLKKKIGVIASADYHIGAEVKNLPITPDYDVNILRSMLHKAAIEINSQNYSETHLIINGDLVESITGLNHLNTFKSLGQGMYGERVIILAFEMLRDDFISRINNLASVRMTSGNHDRISVKSDVDNEGAGCGLLAYMLRMAFPELQVDHDHLLLSFEIDDIRYVVMHGHHKMAAKSMDSIINKYGDNSKYTVIIKGHTHARSVKKGYHIIYGESEVVKMDELKHRMLVCPPLFTGNFFSESIGYTSSAGFLKIKNNGNGKIDVDDKCLS